jgi:hypothetical protein
MRGHSLIVAHRKRRRRRLLWLRLRSAVEVEVEIAKAANSISLVGLSIDRSGEYGLVHRYKQYM